MYVIPLIFFLFASLSVCTGGMDMVDALSTLLWS